MIHTVGDVQWAQKGRKSAKQRTTVSKAKSSGAGLSQANSLGRTKKRTALRAGRK